MKKLARTLLIFLSIVAVGGALWVIFTPNATPDSASISFNIWAGVLSVAFAFLLFLIFKVTDLMKHPKHLKEIILLAVIIAISYVVGTIYAPGDLIATSIVATIVLLIIATVFLVIDTIKGIIK